MCGSYALLYSFSRRQLTGPRHTNTAASDGGFLCAWWQLAACRPALWAHGQTAEGVYHKLQSPRKNGQMVNDIPKVIVYVCNHVFKKSSPSSYIISVSLPCVKFIHCPLNKASYCFIVIHSQVSILPMTIYSHRTIETLAKFLSEKASKEVCFCW